MKTINSIEKVNQLSENEFISTFGNVFEKTNWIANKAFSLKPYKDFDDLTFKLSDNYVGNCYEYKGVYLFNQKKYRQALKAYNSASSYYGEFAFQQVRLMNKKANVYDMLSDFENCLKVIEECILLSKEQNLQ